MNDSHPNEILKMDLSGGDNDWSPTPHGQLLALALAENNLVRGKSVLELGAGVGNHRCFIVQCGQVTHVLAAETDELAGRWIINWRKSTKPGYGACPPAREG